MFLPYLLYHFTDFFDLIPIFSGQDETSFIAIRDSSGTVIFGDSLLLR